MKNHIKAAQSSKVDKICLICEAPFKGRTIDKYCAAPCRKSASKNQQYHFKERHPDKSKVYNQNRVIKNPEVWREKSRQARLDVISALGGKCIVCSATNPNWLHIDYVPTMKGTGLRHPRHKKWVMQHIKDFRLLCANHHYELTLTGKIEGTNITQ
jgi:hypothetical protein